MIKFLIIVFSILILGCRQKNEDLIASSNGRYWDVVKDGERFFNKPSYCYRFRSNGDCAYFYYRKNNDEAVRKLFEYGDVVYPDTWELRFDTLTIKGFNYRIIKISKDTLIMLSATVPGDTMILSISQYQ